LDIIVASYEFNINKTLQLRPLFLGDSIPEKDFLSSYMSFVLFMQIWAHIEKLDAEVLTEDAPPLFRSAVCFGLRRPINEA